MEKTLLIAGILLLMADINLPCYILSFVLLVAWAIITDRKESKR